jgi:hypothetical protein
MFTKNVTLLKIVWRLESRQSFALNKKLVRNNDIDKRIRDGKDYTDLLPEGVAPLSAALVAQRNASGFSTSTPRAGSGGFDSSRSSDGDRLPPPARPHAATIAGPHVSSFKTESNSELEAALAALDSDYNRELSELKKKYADKKAELMKSMRTSSVELS